MPIFKEVYEASLLQGTNMASKIFPETEAAPMAPEGAVSYIPSSESTGCGHEDSMNRLAPFSNEEFPNSETGEGKEP